MGEKVVLIEEFSEQFSWLLSVFTLYISKSSL